jgi:hypothetical protein
MNLRSWPGDDAPFMWTTTVGDILAESPGYAPTSTGP